VSAALLVGVVLASACLAYVLYPVVAPDRWRTRVADQKRSTPRVVTDDEIETAIRSYRASRGARACPVCGPRPESDAVFCSTCGRRLDAASAR
jgi:hypothetical protein